MMDWQAELHRTALLLADNPSDLQALLDRGWAAGQAGDASTCLRSLLAAWRLAGNVPSLLRDIVRAGLRAGDTATALAMARRLIAMDPETPEVEHWYLLGTAMAASGDLAAAIPIMQRCEAMPGGRLHIINSSNLTNVMLTLGDWDAGLPRYERRWDVADAASKARHDHLSRLPTWIPGCDADKVSLIIGGEQGSGDMLMVARFLPAIARRVQHVTVQVNNALLPLLSHSFAAVENLRFVPYDAVDLSAYSHHLMAMSLPLVLATRPDTIPLRDHYLSAMPLGRKFRRSDIRQSIAFAWQGATEHAENSTRSLPHDLTNSFIRRLPEVDFYAVSPPSMSALAFPRPDNLHYLVAQGDDFAVTAALMMEMDLVLSVDSAPCHLAGALGVPVWTLLRRYPDWRWGPNPEGRSPWYASMRLLRQTCDGAWAELLDRVTSDLSKMAQMI